MRLSFRELVLCLDQFLIRYIDAAFGARSGAEHGVRIGSEFVEMPFGRLQRTLLDRANLDFARSKSR